MNYTIEPAGFQHAGTIASIISQSNKGVAKKFNLTPANCPKHPSFCTKEWVLSDIARGEAYFLYQEDGINKGCVAFEQPNSHTAYLNRLSVLPQYRHKGIGEKLVEHILGYAKSKSAQMV